MSRTAHSRRPEAGAQQEDQAAIFGSQWVSGFEAQLNESEYTHLERIPDTAVSVVLGDDSPIHFTANAARTGWIPEPGAEKMVLKGSVSGTFTLSDSSGTVTEFAKADPKATAWQVKSTLYDGLSNSTTTVMSETVTVNEKALARPTRIIAPTSAATASACAADPSTKGCRLLEYVYASSTTATSSALGNFSGQVREIRLWSTEPGASAATAKAVQAYQYDDAGRLRRAWNPQITPSLVTEYGYDTAGRITSLTLPGTSVDVHLRQGRQRPGGGRGHAPGSRTPDRLADAQLTTVAYDWAKGLPTKVVHKAELAVDDLVRVIACFRIRILRTEYEHIVAAATQLDALDSLAEVGVDRFVAD